MCFLFSRDFSQNITFSHPHTYMSVCVCHSVESKCVFRMIRQRRVCFCRGLLRLIRWKIEYRNLVTIFTHKMERAKKRTSSHRGRENESKCYQRHSNRRAIHRMRTWITVAAYSWNGAGVHFSHIILFAPSSNEFKNWKCFSRWKSK